MRNYDAPERMAFRLNAKPQLDPTDSLQIIATRPFRILEPKFPFREAGRTARNTRYKEQQLSNSVIHWALARCLRIGDPSGAAGSSSEGIMLNPDTLVLSWKMWKPQDYAELLIEVQAEGETLYDLRIDEKRKANSPLAFRGHCRTNDPPAPITDCRSWKTSTATTMDACGLEAEDKPKKMFYEEPILL